MGRVGVVAAEQVVETSLGVRERWRQRHAKQREPWGPDRDEQRGHRLDPALEIGDAGCDEVVAGKPDMQVRGQRSVLVGEGVLGKLSVFGRPNHSSGVPPVAKDEDCSGGCEPVRCC